MYCINPDCKGSPVMVNKIYDLAEKKTNVKYECPECGASFSLVEDYHPLGEYLDHNAQPLAAALLYTKPDVDPNDVIAMENFLCELMDRGLQQVYAEMNQLKDMEAKE